MIIRTYSELITLPTFEERFKYLQLNGKVGKDTFGFDRIFNQLFYTSNEWRDIRHYIIVRDNGCDLGVPGHDIPDGVKIYIHHMNPITIDDIRDATEYLLNPDYLITTIFNTHQAIHYGDISMLNATPITRSRYDTCPWRK